MWKMEMVYLGVAHVLATACIRLDIINQGACDERRVGVQDRLFRSIDDDTRSWSFDLDVRVDDLGTSAGSLDGHEDLAGDLVVIVVDQNAPEELALWTSNTDDQECG